MLRSRLHLLKQQNSLKVIKHITKNGLHENGLTLATKNKMLPVASPSKLGTCFLFYPYRPSKPGQKLRQGRSA